MAKLQDTVIEKSDIETYLNDLSDFTFEIKTLKAFTSLGFECEHAGTYDDPVTGKTREFDIRARKRLLDEEKLKLDLSLSVECKNIKDNFPLVIHSTKRTEAESYLDLVWSSYNYNKFLNTISYGISECLFVGKNHHMRLVMQ